MYFLRTFRKVRIHIGAHAVTITIPNVKVFHLYLISITVDYFRVLNQTGKRH